MTLLLGVDLVLTCQHTGCQAQEAIDLMDTEAPITEHGARDIATYINEDWPEGWGFDFAGVNHVLHCPRHRA